MTNRPQTTIETLFANYQDILLKTLCVLPVSYLPNRTFESIPARVEEYVKENANFHNDIEQLHEEVEYQFPELLNAEDTYTCHDIGKMLIEKCNKALVEAFDANDELRELKARIKEDYAYFAGFGADSNADTEDQLNFLFRSKLAMGNVKSGDTSESFKYKEALEEIIKRPQRSETCRMIAQKALGLLTDEDSQPELLIEENLKLKIELEDLKAKLNGVMLDKAFEPSPYLW